MDTTRHTLALDQVRQGLAKITDISGERIHKLQWSAFANKDEAVLQGSVQRDILQLQQNHPEYLYLSLEHS